MKKILFVLAAAAVPFTIIVLVRETDLERRTKAARLVC